MIKALLLCLVLILVLPYLVPLSRPLDRAPEGPFPRSRSVTVGGSTLHYRVFEAAGDEEVGRVLLVHGLGGSTDSFRHTFWPLAEAGYRVVAVDLPGFGYSQRIPGFDHRQTARAALLWEFLGHLGNEGLPWHLVGHSMGGGTVAAMALQEPAKTRQVILVDGALGETRRGPTALLNLPPLGRWTQVILDRFLITEDRIGDFLASAYGRDPSEAEIKAFYDPLKIPGTARSALDLLKTSGNLPVEALTGIRAPVVGIWGALDTWVTPGEGEALAGVFKDYAFHVIPGAAHCPMETHEEAFNRLLLGALEVEEEEAME
jgi:pimeloyl-ACP methyl ester carboxylesterase